MTKLWNKGYELNPEVEAFITGKNFILDDMLVKADCVASIAHTKTLLRCNTLKDKECDMLCKELRHIFHETNKGAFHIAREMEDCHTAIELALTKRLGDVGKKIHMGRSRNDQVQAALRLYMKEYMLVLACIVAECVQVFISRAEEYQNLPMVGRSHLQVAMPSTVGLYLASYAEQLIDDLDYVDLALKHVNRSPLGSAAGYGIPLDMDRAYTAKLLCFAEVQNNVIAVQNSRARLECEVIDALGCVALTISRFAEDFILFTLPELSYFSLPQQLCSGSSIMPQKKNPDVLEFLRAYASHFIGYSVTLRSLVKGLPSGYQADIQLSKEPVLQSMHSMKNLLTALHTVLCTFDVHKENLMQSFTPEVYATDEAYRLVQEQSMPFRQAYAKAAHSYRKAASHFTPEQVLKLRTAQGTPGAPNLDYALHKIKQMHLRYKTQRETMAQTLALLLQTDTCTLI